MQAGSTPLIIMPYMANGSLLRYLRRQREEIVLTTSGEHNADEVLAQTMLWKSPIHIHFSCYLIGSGNSKATVCDVLPDSQWNGVFGSRESYTPRPHSKELHVSS